VGADVSGSSGDEDRGGHEEWRSEVTCRENEFSRVLSIRPLDFGKIG